VLCRALTGAGEADEVSDGVVAVARRALLPFVAVALLVGAVASFVGSHGLAVAVWSVASGVVVVDLVVVTIGRLREGRVAVDVVALVALLGAMAMGEALAGVILALMVASGDALEQYAHRRAQRSLSELLSLAPKTAHRLVDGSFETVPVDEVAPGEVLLVKPGEVVPADGSVLESAVLDESVLTGESQSVQREVGELARSGSVNAGGAFRMRASVSASESAYAGIVRLVRSAGVGKAPFVRLADRYAVMFVPAVFLIAGGTWLVTGDLTRVLAVLVVATPCPLVLAAPVAVVSGIACAARNGAVVKDGAALEAMGQTRTVLLDKTGTLTAGRANVVAVLTAPGSEAADVLSLAASVEQASPHVLAAMLVREARGRGLTLVEPAGVIEQPGSGVSGTITGRHVWVGVLTSMGAEDRPPWLTAADRRARREGCSTTAVVVDGAAVGLILFTDELRTDTSAALRALRRAGVHRVVMVTGDRLEVAEPIGMSLGIDQVFADRTPSEKLDVVRAESSKRSGITVMVGDGVNDAPALAAADLGVAMGARGATASSEAADVVLIVDRLDRLASGVVIAKRARAIARQSVLLGMGLSLVGMAAAAIGVLAPVGGAVAQEVIDVLAIGSALRALRQPRSLRHTTSVPDSWSHQLAEGHGPLRLVLEDLRSVALAMDSTDEATALTLLRNVAARISDEVVPHEREDESEIYPVVAERLGGNDPLASMSRTHQEIFHLASLLGRLVDDASVDGFSEEDRSEARRILYALDAILRLHFAQEEELLASITLDGPHESQR
jgi:heavy metal translocating P-type ATPase